MYTQYRYKGRFVSAQDASRISHLPKIGQFVTTHIRDKTAGPAYTELKGFFRHGSLEWNMRIDAESDRRRRDEEIARRAEYQRRQREKERERYIGGPEKREEPRYVEYTGQEEFAGLPYDPLPDEDELLDDYFDEAIEVADIDDETYEVIKR